jgi:predicted O-methyltransferase YrrM
VIARALRHARQLAFPLFRGVPAIRIEDALGAAARCRLDLADWALDPGAGSFWDLAAVALIARVHAPRVCFEIGTGHGRTTLQLALNTPPETLVYTLDVVDPAVIGSVYRRHPEGGKVRQLTGDSGSFDFRPFAGTVDLILVDGDHGYEAVARDTATALSLLAPGGRVIWDDFAPGWPGVVRAIKRSPICRRVRHLAGTKLAYFDSGAAP